MKVFLGACLRLIRWHQPVGTWLLLWPTLQALFATNTVPPWQLIVVFSLGVVLCRSAGCVINDMFDSDIDAKVERTATRPLAMGQLRQHHGRYGCGGIVGFGVGFSFATE